MNIVEVSYCSWNCKFHRSELSNEVFQIFSSYVALCGQHIEEGNYPWAIIIQEIKCTCLHYHSTYHDFLYTSPVSLCYHQILDAHQVFYLIGKRQEEPLEILDGAIKNLSLLPGPALHCCDYVTHI